MKGELKFQIANEHVKFENTHVDILVEDLFVKWKFWLVRDGCNDFRFDFGPV